MRRVFVLKELSNKKYTKRIRAERERERGKRNGCDRGLGVKVTGEDQAGK